MQTSTSTPALLITGASRGIGAATARQAAAAGWDIVLSYRLDAAAAAAVADEVRGLGRRAWVLQADVGQEAEVLAMFAALDQALASAGGRLAGLVNNAGVVDVAARVQDMSGARLQRMFAVNVLGTMWCAREAVQRMSTRQGGRGGQGGAIVNLSSAAARLGAPGQYVDYAAAKGAVDVFTLGLAKEVAAEGVRVNAVRPGVIDTEIPASGGQPDRATQLAPLVPMQRAGSADEIAAAIVWLLSDGASYTTGALLDVSGGR